MSVNGLFRTNREQGLKYPHQPYNADKNGGKKIFKVIFFENTLSNKEILISLLYLRYHRNTRIEAAVIMHSLLSKEVK